MCQVIVATRNRCVFGIFIFLILYLFRTHFRCLWCRTRLSSSSLSSSSFVDFVLVQYISFSLFVFFFSFILSSALHSVCVMCSTRCTLYTTQTATAMMYWANNKKKRTKINTLRYNSLFSFIPCSHNTRLHFANMCAPLTHSHAHADEDASNTFLLFIGSVRGSHMCKLSKLIFWMCGTNCVPCS